MKILVVDDDFVNLRAQEMLLRKSGYEVVTAQSGKTAIEILRRDPCVFALAILDYRMQDMDGAETAEAILRVKKDIFILIHSGDSTQQAALSSWRAGAVFFIEKSADADRFLSIVGHWFKKHADEFELLTLSDSTVAEKDIARIGMIGRSKALQQLARVVTSAGFRQSESSILIQGENGTGKELLARAVHQYSPRANGPFVALNCAAIPENLIESELFGFERGAFTGAEKSKIGLFQAANGGTLFLDEVGEASPSMQTKLLRVIQERVFRPLGATAEISCDVRVVAATNRNLDDEIRRGSFREDLYYRLAVLTLHLPPLRERVEDIEALVLSFTTKYNQESGEQKGFLKEAVRVLSRYSWPGNIRELDNVITRLLQFTPGERITLNDFDEVLLGRVREPKPKSELKSRVAELSKEAILEAIRTTTSKREAAKKLSLPWSTFRSMLRRLGIEERRESRGVAK